MFENRRYQGVIARAGRGRHTRTCRRIFEFNLLIIGALIFVGIGIASLQSDTDQTANQAAKLKPPERTSAQLRDNIADEPKTIDGAPEIVIATLLRGDGIMVRTAVLEVALPSQILVHSTTRVTARKIFETAAKPSRDASALPSVIAAGWVRTPHPLAVPLPLVSERPTHRIVRTSYGLTATGDLTKDPPAPLVRLDTTTGKSSFWYVVAGLSLAAFACGFWNTQEPR